MTGDYLDITKNVMISSPAGSGKTEKLARRYISLLKGGSAVERILAITFTDKAAAEIKERILNILRLEAPDLFEKVREKVPRMRISTIHSFCLKLLKRFAIELEIDPSLESLDSFNAGILWSEALYESLLEESNKGKEIFSDIIKNEGIKGWNKLVRIFNELHSRRPPIEIGLSNSILQHYRPDDKRLDQIIAAYSTCLERYKKKKREKHLIDYDDFEILAYEAITRNPEWQNILFSFDEHTDHILIDEFQDTSTLQWKIIDKLTEEWRSGIGAKREYGVKPTIFLVGDEKQSIYSFRGANVNVFKEAKERLSRWLNEEFVFIEVEENFRSLPAIIDFTNQLFEKIMPKDSEKRPGGVSYSPFKSERDGNGKVSLCIINSTGKIRDDRKKEAQYVAYEIINTINTDEIYDKSIKRKPGYGDIAILLRSRTHLSLFEDALRQVGIPFVVIKGIGFYQSPEVAMLRDLLFFLIDQKDDYSLFNILRSPLFGISYEELLEIVFKKNANETKEYLFALIQRAAKESMSNEGESLKTIFLCLTKWIERSKKLPLAILIEEILNETEGWRYLSEPQRHRNVKKFLRLVETFESEGLTGLEIREKLIKATGNPEEPKANVNSEGLDAVRIMTIHAAKGLQFPIVFLPCLDEEHSSIKGQVIFEDAGDQIIIDFKDNSEGKNKSPLYIREKEKTEEEEKRLFYVAVTRAMDHLYMSGIRKDKTKGKLLFIESAFNIDLSQDINNTDLPFTIKVLEKGLEVVSDKITVTSQRSEPYRDDNIPLIYINAIDSKQELYWRDVTEEIDYVRRKHGDNWVVLGRIFHSLFERLSRSLITIDEINDRIDLLIRQEIASTEAIRLIKDIINVDIERLKNSGLLEEIILPRKNSFTELPFVLQKGHNIYRGRVDRVIFDRETAKIYDYKTYPVAEKEIPELKERYLFQLQLYREAIEKIFSVRAETYLFFTHELKIVRV